MDASPSVTHSPLVGPPSDAPTVPAARDTRQPDSGISGAARKTPPEGLVPPQRIPAHDDDRTNRIVGPSTMLARRDKAKTVAKCPAASAVNSTSSADGTPGGATGGDDWNKPYGISRNPTGIARDPPAADAVLGCSPKGHVELLPDEAPAARPRAAPSPTGSGGNRSLLPHRAGTSHGAATERDAAATPLPHAYPA